MTLSAPSSTDACLFPASASQRGLWLLEKLDGPNPAYNIPATIRLNGVLETNILRDSLQDLMCRHDGLRTAISDLDGEPQQTVYDEMSVDFSVVDIPSEEALVSSLLVEAGEFFTLDTAPLWRVRLFQLSKTDHVLQIVLHHAIADGYSLMVLLRDLVEIYNSRNKGLQIDLPELPVQFGDYACWEDSTFKLLQDDGVDYWRGKLADLPELKLPGGLPRPEKFSYAGRILREKLPQDAVIKLEECALEAGLSPFIIYLGILQIALQRWTGQSDVPLGVPVAARTRPELIDMVGFLTNTLVVRYPVDISNDFLGYCKNLARSFKDDLEYSDIPFELLSREILDHRDASKNPFFQIMFAYQQEPEALPAFGDAEASVMDLPLEVAHFDLHVEVVCRNDSRQLNLEFATDMVTESSVRDLISIIHSAVEQFSVAPKSIIKDMSGTQFSDELPLSPHQERIWFIDSFESGNVYPGHPTYHNLPIIIPRQNWDPEMVEVAAKQILSRHEGLRARIKMSSDGPILENRESTEIVLDNLTVQNGSGEGGDCVIDYVFKPFDPGSDLLFRVGIGKAEDDSELLVLVTHHLLADRRSLGIIARDFIELYEDASAEKNTKVIPVPNSFRDALHDESKRQILAYDQDLEYWKGELELPLAPLELPADFARHPVHLYEQTRYSIELKDGLSGKLRGLAESHQCTLESVFLGAFQLLMSRYSGQGEIVLGIPEPVFSETVAPLSNLLCCRERVSMDSTFVAHLLTVHQHLTAMRRHGDLSFDRLVKAIDPSKDMSRTALFDVLFEFTSKSPYFTDLNIGYGKYDLHAHFLDSEDGVKLNLAFNNKLYKKRTIELMFHHFQVLLESIVEEPEKCLGSFGLMLEGERQLQIIEWNDTLAEFPNGLTIHQLFENCVTRAPGKVAMRDEGKEYTYAEINERANVVANQLIGLEVQDEELIGICLDKSAECVVAMLGVLKAGAAYLPLDPGFPEARLQWILEDAGVRIVIGEGSFLDKLDVPLVIDIHSIEQRNSSNVNPEKEIKASRLAYCIYTSGSTGKPKGVLVEHEQVVRLMVNDRSPFDFKSSDVWTFFHSPCFDFSVWEMYGALLFGGTLVVVPKCVAEDSVRFADLLVEEGITVLNQTPTSFYYLASEFLDKPREHQIHTVIFGGETLSPLRIRDFHENYPAVKLVNMFGITETTVHVTYKELKGSDFDSNSNLIGRPIPTTTCYILDALGNLLPAGIHGEIHVGGKGVARGYLNRPELSEERFIANPFDPGTKLYRTGDKAYALENGELVHLGRLDSQIQIRGYRVEIGEIQSQLLQHPSLRDVLITTQRLESDGTSILVAYAVLEKKGELTDFAEYLSDSLPGYMIPSRFIEIDEIPLTPNGKADIANLPEVTSLPQKSDAVEGPLAGKIGDIWQQLLGIECIGQKDDFFKMGGYSLLATRMLAMIERELGCNVSLRSLFENPVLSDFTRHVAKMMPEADVAAEADDGAAPLLMSSTQKRLWFLDKLEKQSIAYHLFGAVTLDEQPDVDVLGRALQYVVDKHPALRTGFPDIDGEPQPLLSESISMHLEVEDLSHLQSEHQMKEFKALSTNYSRVAFDLAKPPLVRACLYLFSGGEARLVIGIHHIIADGWALSILFHDLQTAYKGLWEKSISLENFKPLANPILPEVSESRKQELLGYWKPKLTGIEPLCLPTDFPRPSIATAEGGQFQFRIEQELVDQLNSFCNDSGYTPFMVCLGVFELLLSRKARQKEFALGIPLANRVNTESHSAVGCFVNTMPAVAEVDEEKSFIDLLEQVRRTTLEIQENQQLPFDQLVDAINPERDMGSHPLYQVIFNYQESLFRETDQVIPDIEPVDTGASQVDLALYLDGQSDSLKALLVYRTSLFKQSSINKIAEQFEQALKACLDQPESRLDSHVVLPNADRRLLSQWNDTGMEWNSPLVLNKLFERIAQDTPDKIAATIGEESMTYGELENSANALAVKLVDEYGVSNRMTVAICYERSFEMLVSMLAIMKAGGAYLPLDSELPSVRIEQMLEISGTQLVITSSAFAEKMTTHSVHVCIYQVTGSSTDTQAPEVDISPEDSAYVIFTSGSTGEPKGVVNCHQAICNRLLWMRDYLSVDTQSDKILQKTPYTFDVSLWDVFLPLISGVELVFARPGGHMDPSYLVGEIKRSKITTLHFVPSMLQVFLLHPKASSCGSLKHVVCSGEALPSSLADAFHNMLPGVALHNLYGPTEAAVDVTAWKCVPGDTNISVPIGRPINNLAIRIVDPFLRDVAVTDQGEICIEGIGLAEGYCNNTELTDAVFVSDPLSPEQRMYLTGDLGRFRDDGVIEFHGRIDNQVKVRGLRVELDEIDHVLRSLDGIADSATVVPDGKDALYSYIVVDANAPANISSDVVKSELKKRLPDYMIPIGIFQIGNLPLSRHGKIDRAKLSRLKVVDSIEQEDFQDEWERLVAEVWSDLLDSDAFGRNDNFFDAGGHSLLLIKVHLELEKRSGVHIELVDLFSHPTVAALADLLRDVSGTVKTAQEKPIAEESADIAVIGMSGRFPGAATLEEFKSQILQGKPVIRFFTKEELVESGAGRELLEHPDYVPAQGALEDVDAFDASYFSFSPAEATRLDPQARVFLTCAEEALQNAGIVPGDSESTIGVFAGSSLSTYGMLQMAGKDTSLDPDVFSTVLANDKDYLATRTAYKLGLKGPALSIQTACSTSLSAVHVACQSLLNGECDTAIAGGVSIQAGIPPGYIYQQDGILSPDGHCRAFSKDAEGTVQGAGCGTVVLKSLSRALAAGDDVLAVIKGSAMNNDGDDKVGFTAPGVTGQQQVIQSALDKAGITADSISYIETHGTGTALGDMIEVSALKTVFSGTQKHHCVLGAVKSQIGHLDAAAGIAGLIKTVICLKEKKIPPTLYGDSPNPDLGLDDSPFVLNPEMQEWQTEDNERFAGVSSFGIGGTNVHVVLQGVNEDLDRTVSNEPVIIILSAPTESSLELRKAWLIDNLDAEISLPALAWSLQSGRKQWPIREAYIADGYDNLIEQLEGGNYEEVEVRAGYGRLIELRDSWLQGNEVDWRELYLSGPPCRVALPPFPFEYKKFWALGREKQGRKSEGSNDSIVEPLVYNQSYRPVTVKTGKQEGAFLLVVDQAGKQFPKCVLPNAEVTEVDVETFLNVSGSSIKPFDKAMLILAGPDTGDSHAEILLRVQRLVSAALERKVCRLLIVDSKGNGLAANTWQSMLESFLIVLRQENPAMDIRLLQMDALDDNSAASAVNILLSDAIPYPVLKYSGNTFLVPQFSIAELSSREQSPIREHGKYLITGASGGIAHFLAIHLAKRYQGELYLASRKKIDSDLIAELEQLGSTVRALQVDVNDAVSISSAMEGIAEMDGVFHLAGVSGDAALLSTEEMNESAIDHILAPKIEVTINLLNLAKSKGCKFFVGFSSISTVLGGLGFSVYSAANAVMDALLDKCNADSDLECYSIDWDGWNLSKQTVSGQLDPDEAFRVMDDIMGNGQAGRYFVAASPLGARICDWVLMEKGGSVPVQKEVSLDSREDAQRELESIWRELLGVERIQQNDGFSTLGGDSLLAVQMLAMITKRFSAKISMRDIMDASSIDALVDLLWEKRTPSKQARETGEI